jgi:hypothetical protein
MCRVDVDIDGHMLAPRTQRLGIPEFVFPSVLEQASESLPAAASRSSGSRSRLIPARCPETRYENHPNVSLNPGFRRVGGVSLHKLVTQQAVVPQKVLRAAGW